MVIPNMSALALSKAIHNKQVSCREVMQAYLKQIETYNPASNAIVSLAPQDALLAQADERDAQLGRGQSMGWMHGLPQAVKDLLDVQGFRTSHGSPLTPLAPAGKDSLMAARMRAAGCIMIGKTNTPEFGLGSHTFNEVFGATRNAWDPSKTAGGSSGGAAVALAQRMLPVADGSDFMGSLRNPAGWNHVFGMRPSQGRVPRPSLPDVFIAQLGTEGPMARSVSDMAMLLSTQAGYDARAPLSIQESGAAFAQSLDASMKGKRVGWLGNLNGYLPMEAGVLEVCQDALKVLETTGCSVDTTHLGMQPEEIWDAWLVWRKALAGASTGAYAHLPNWREKVKPEAQWEYDQSLDLTGTQLMKASAARTRYYQSMIDLFESFDVLAIPAAQVWPFDIKERWPQNIEGRSMDTYHRWMEVVIYPTFAGLPAISVPAGFNAQGLPMGLQLIGKPKGDFELLQVAHAYEMATQDLIQKRPPGL
ncbi:MAG: amidase [Burkholderiales bacterium]